MRPFLAFALVACNTDVQIAQNVDVQSTQERLGLTDAQVADILDFLNNCSTDFDTLDTVVGLDSDAAENLIESRDGADGDCGNRDDTPYETLDAVDAVTQVGDSTILDILAYIEGSSDGSGAWEGVEFSQHEQEVALEIANDAAESVLNEEVGLPSDAAANIVAARPIDSMSDLADVAQVGESAMQKIKDYIPVWGG